MRDNNEWAGIAGIQVVPRVDPLSATPLTIYANAGSSTVTLDWPGGVGEVILQTSSNLQSWIPVVPSPDSNSIIVPAASQQQFFRLSRP